MSVVSIERLTERGGTLGATEDTFQTYLVRTDSRDDDHFVVRSAIEAHTGVGTYLTPHLQNAFYTRRDILLNAPTALHWTARVKWSTKPVSTSERERNEEPNPLNRRNKVSLLSLEFQEYDWQDAKQKALRNSAGDMYDPLPFPRSHPIIQIRRNIDTYNADWSVVYPNSTNSANVTISDGKVSYTLLADYGLMKTLTVGELQEENGVEFYESSCTIHVSTNTDRKWKLRMIDEGYRYKSGSDMKRFSELDKDGTATNSPVKNLLNGSGGALAVGGTPVFNDFDQFTESDWNALPFF